MSLGDVYRTTWVFTHPEAAAPMTTGLDYRLDVVNTARTEIEFCQDLLAVVTPFIVSDYMPSINTQFTLVKTECFNIDQPQFASEQLSGASGSNVNEAVALRSAPVASKATGLRGRSNRGRMYLMAPAENQQNGGNLAEATKTLITDFLNDLKLVSDITTNEFNAVVYSEKLASSQLITNFVVRDILGGIRKRQKVN